MGGHRQSSRRHNRGITEDVATGIGGLHKAADGLLGPLKPIDDVCHGVARGSINWLTGTHPGHDTTSESDSDEPPPPPRRKSYGSYGGGGNHNYTGGYPNRKRDVFTGNKDCQIGNVSGSGHVQDCAKFTVN